MLYNNLIKLIIPILVISLLLASCSDSPEKNKEQPKDKEQPVVCDDADMKSIVIAGKAVEFGDPGLNLASAEEPLLIFVYTELAAPVPINIVTNSEKAIAGYGRMSQSGSTPIWQYSGLVTLAYGDILCIRITAENGKIQFYKFLVKTELLGSLHIAGISANTGNSAPAFSQISNSGFAAIPGLLAGSAEVELTLAQGAVFRIAKTTGSEEPQWSDLPSYIYSFSENDFLYIEVTSANSQIKQYYKIVISINEVEDTVSISGFYTLILNSNIPQQRVVIEAHNSRSNGELISRAEANLFNNTWSLLVPFDSEVWFFVIVTDTTGYTFGKVVSETAQYFMDDTQNINLTLGPFAPPEITTFSLIGAQSTNSVRQDKPGTINHSTGIITFANTSFTTVGVHNIIRFDKLAANFTLPDGVKLFAGNTEQISGVSENNYYKDVIFTVIAEDNVRKVYSIAGQNLIIDHTLPNAGAAGNNNNGDYNRIVGTRSWQTQGFGIMVVNTTDTTTGLPVGTNVDRLNYSKVWNRTGTYTYISPTGRVLTGATDIRATGNWTMRTDWRKSYNLRLNVPQGLDYYDFKTRQYRTLPEHRRWRLLAHVQDPTRIRTPLAWEMGRHVLGNMGWQPHADWVYFFLNGEFMGLYIQVENIQPEEGRQGIAPIISPSNPSGGWSVEMNNFYFYFNESWATGGFDRYTFKEEWAFMTSHQNPASHGQQGIVWTMDEPNSDLGWWFPQPLRGDGNLSWNNPAHASFFPRYAIALQATMQSRGVSNPPNLWKVPDDLGSPNGIGTGNFLLYGSFNINSFNRDGGIRGSRTLGQVYPEWESSSFVRIAQYLQNVEDAIYSHDWVTKGYGQGSYLDLIDVGSFIDFHIAGEMTSDWELLGLNGRYAHYCPKIKKFKMGPLWDFDNMWNMGERGSYPGFYRQTSFYYKELLGWEILDDGSGRWKTPRNHCPYYTDQLKTRWNFVKTRFNFELNDYIDSTIARFNRVTGFNNPISLTGDGYHSRVYYKNHLTDMVNRLDSVFNGY